MAHAHGLVARVHGLKTHPHGAQQHAHYAPKHDLCGDCSPPRAAGLHPGPAQPLHVRGLWLARLGQLPASQHRDTLRAHVEARRCGRAFVCTCVCG